MMLNVADKNDEPESKDILDLDLDMSIGMKDDKYIVNLNNKYRLYDTFLTKEDAKFQMFSIANARNKLETEFREQL